MVEHAYAHCGRGIAVSCVTVKILSDDTKHPTTDHEDQLASSVGSVVFYSRTEYAQQCLAIIIDNGRTV